MSSIVNLTKKHGKGTILQELSNVHSKETDHLNVIQNFCKQAWKCLKQLIIKNKLSVKVGKLTFQTDKNSKRGSEKPCTSTSTSTLLTDKAEFRITSVSKYIATL